MLSSTKSCTDGKMPGFLKCNKYRGNRKNVDVVIEYLNMNQLLSYFKKFIVRGADSKELMPRGWESAAVGR